jgi:hypothetical protein
MLFLIGILLEYCDMFNIRLCLISFIGVMLGYNKFKVHVLTLTVILCFILNLNPKNFTPLSLLCGSC